MKEIERLFEEHNRLMRELVEKLDNTLAVQEEALVLFEYVIDKAKSEDEDNSQVLNQMFGSNPLDSFPSIYKQEEQK